MNEAFELLSEFTDSELLRFIAVCVVGIFTIKLAGALYNTAKVIHDWLSSLFPTGIDKK